MGQKGQRKPTQRSLLEHTKRQVLVALETGKRKDLIILVIPSHDRKNRALPDQNMWAEAGAEVLAEAYRGATAFKASSGIFKTDEGDILRDQPILLEAYADREQVVDDANLDALLTFAMRMGRDADQDTVMLVVNDFMHYIPTKSL